MKIATTIATYAISLIAFASACPYSNTGADAPNDAAHSHLRRRRLASLSEDDETRQRLADIVKNRNRYLQDISCVSDESFNNLCAALDEIKLGISNLGDRGHFIGGIVRLAAHDFMDFDQSADVSNQEFGGSDGCIDFGHEANAGLPELWCDNSCPFKDLYDGVDGNVGYSSIMSRADFWVASATCVMNDASPNGNLNLPFQWGRVDSESCPNSSSRLPEPSGCDQVEGTFIDRMGLTWTDATALLGAHTLGRGDTNFSGHNGTWVRDDAASVDFDKRFYTEILGRAWRPNETPENVPDDDWTWGNDLPVMMLHTDICLSFDIDNEQRCCTDTTRNCRGFTEQCPDSSQVRPEAFAAVNSFASGGNNDNAAFFSAFTTAWGKATGNGYDSLNDLVSTCDNEPPVESPVASPVTSPVESPVASPVESPVQSPVGTCEDVESFIDRKGKTRDCAWVLDKMKCDKYSNECPVSCEACP